MQFLFQISISKYVNIFIYSYLPYVRISQRLLILGWSLHSCIFDGNERLLRLSDLNLSSLAIWVPSFLKIWVSNLPSTVPKPIPCSGRCQPGWSGTLHLDLTQSNCNFRVRFYKTLKQLLLLTKNQLLKLLSLFPVPLKDFLLLWVLKMVNKKEQFWSFVQQIKVVPSYTKDCLPFKSYNEPLDGWYITKYLMEVIFCSARYQSFWINLKGYEKRALKKKILCWYNFHSLSVTFIKQVVMCLLNWTHVSIIRNGVDLHPPHGGFYWMWLFIFVLLWVL